MVDRAVGWMVLRRRYERATSSRHRRRSPQAMFDYYAQVNQWRIDPPVVRRLCEEAGAALESLVSLGIDFPVESLKRSGMETVSARGHQPVG